MVTFIFFAFDISFSFLLSHFGWTDLLVDDLDADGSEINCEIVPVLVGERLDLVTEGRERLAGEASKLLVASGNECYLGHFMSPIFRLSIPNTTSGKWQSG